MQAHVNYYGIFVQKIFFIQMNDIFQTPLHYLCKIVCMNLGIYSLDGSLADSNHFKLTSKGLSLIKKTTYKKHLFHYIFICTMHGPIKKHYHWICVIQTKHGFIHLENAVNTIHISWQYLTHAKLQSTYGPLWKVFKMNA